MATHGEGRRSGFEKNEGWENSTEGVVCRMTFLGSSTTRADEDRAIIARTLLGLPKGIREKVLEKVAFVYTEAEGVICPFCPPPIGIQVDETRSAVMNRLYISERRPRGVILFNFRGIPEVGVPHLLAHEMAHFILGHKWPKNQGGRSEEMAADDLSESWGFKRAYQTYDRHRE
jgi:hypothetical protein